MLMPWQWSAACPWCTLLCIQNIVHTCCASPDGPECPGILPTRHPRREASSRPTLQVTVPAESCTAWLGRRWSRVSLGYMLLQDCLPNISESVKVACQQLCDLSEQEKKPELWLACAVFESLL